MTCTTCNGTGEAPPRSLCEVCGEPALRWHWDGERVHAYCSGKCEWTRYQPTSITIAPADRPEGT